ncbi:MAG: type II toxin-antitoxin system RelE/ParE family toxin [Enterocloster sp.]
MDYYKIIITPDAETDLFEIRDYIAYTLLVPDVALNYIRAIRSEIQKLTYMASNIAPIEREPWHSRGVRKITAKNFIYYPTDDSSGRVYILKNGTPHSRYFSDELGVPNFLINTEQMFAI